REMSGGKSRAAESCEAGTPVRMRHALVGSARARRSLARDRDLARFDRVGRVAPLIEARDDDRVGAQPTYELGDVTEMTVKRRAPDVMVAKVIRARKRDRCRARRSRSRQLAWIDGLAIGGQRQAVLAGA